MANPPDTLTMRLVTDWDELQSLGPAWQELLEHSASAEPMCSPAWLLTWWETYGRNLGLHVGLFHDGAQLVGLAPLCQRRAWHRPGIPMTRLEFLGSELEDPDGICSEYLNLIVRAGHEERVAQAFAHAIDRGAFGRWHELVLGAMNGDDAMPDRLLAAFRALGYAGEKQTTMQAPFVPLPANWDAYLMSLPSNKRRYLKMCMRDFEAWAGNDWQLESATTPASLAKGQAILHALHNHRWQDGDGLAGAFSRPRFAAFHQAYMTTALAAGTLDLFWLSVRGEPIAVYYQFKTNGKVYFYQSGRQLDLPAEIRPGIVITIQAIRRAIEQGLREYDFLGGQAQYKLQFTKLLRPLVQVRIAPSCPREWLRRGAEKAIAYARRCRDALRRWRSRASDA